MGLGILHILKCISLKGTWQLGYWYQGMTNVIWRGLTSLFRYVKLWMMNELTFERQLGKLKKDRKLMKANSAKRCTIDLNLIAANFSLSPWLPCVLIYLAQCESWLSWVWSCRHALGFNHTGFLSSCGNRGGSNKARSRSNFLKTLPEKLSVDISTTPIRLSSLLVPVIMMHMFMRWREIDL